MTLETNDLELLELLLAEEGIDLDRSSQIPRRGLTRAPLSFQQRRLWFIHELDPNSSAYNICAVFRLDGQLEFAALATAFHQLQQRHESLRTTFIATDGEPEQVVRPHPLAELLWEDWSDRPSTEAIAAVPQLAKTEAAHPFDLENGPLIRGRVWCLNREQHILSLAFHHIIADARSLSVALAELTVLYRAVVRGEEATLPELPIQYSDYALAQQEKSAAEDSETQLEYWQQQLADLPILPFPTDFPRPKLQSFRGDLVHFTLSPSLTEALRRFSRLQETTPFATLMAAFEVLLARYTGQLDFAVGTSIANRPGVETQNAIGFFVNMLAVRADLEGEPSFCTLVEGVKQTLLAGFEKSEVPFETLVDRLQVERDTSRNPLFQVAFTLLEASQPAIEAPDLQVVSLATQEAARFDLELFVTDEGERVSATLSYNTDLFARKSAERLSRHFCQLLAALLDRPDIPVGRVPFLLSEETIYAQPQQSFAIDECLHEIFTRQVQARPESIALSDENQTLTYRELERRANRLAHVLVEFGVRPETRVGLFVDRSLELVVAIVAILKAGGVYVPLDVHSPRERLAYILQDSRVGIVLTQEALVDRLPAWEARTWCACELELDSSSVASALLLLEAYQDELAAATVAPPVAVHPDNLAYIIYTSGSTGKPKGVMVPHRNVVRLMLATQGWFGFNPTDVWTLFHSCAFDFSVWEIWGALFYGGRLIIVPYWVTRSPHDFYNLLCDAKVTVLNQTPSAFRQLMQAEAQLGREGELELRYVIFGGEALDIPSLEPWFDRHSDDFPQLVNMYGITETTVHVTYRPISLRDVKLKVGSAIGTPLPDLSLHLFDAWGQPIPEGAIGELYVGGAGVMRGYLDRPRLSAERLVPDESDPTGKRRLYKTGDLARWTRDGDLEYLGRNDRQVKIRGFRLELGEIEGVLRSQPGVRDARVLTWGKDRDDLRLVAYLIPEPDAARVAGYEELSREQTKEWQSTFDETYRDRTREIAPDFNIAGWNSSYDGQPIPAVEMRHWLDSTLDRIQGLQPQRVLEIGCGTGMILLNLADRVESYWATDFSRVAVERLQGISKERGWDWVRFFEREATDFTDLPTDYFDTIILNSVAQYFPSADYLQRVIAGAIAALAPGGSFFIGDNRHLPTLDIFHASMVFASAGEAIDWQCLCAERNRETFGQQMARVAAKDNELVLDPQFFLHLPQIFDALAAVEIHLKQEKTDNELSNYRYDVVLHKKGGDRIESAVHPVWHDWQEGIDIAAQWEKRMRPSWNLISARTRTKSAIATDSEPVIWGWRGIPNARLRRDLAIWQWWQSEEEGESAECTPAFPSPGGRGFLTPRKDVLESNSSGVGGPARLELDDGGVDPADLYALARSIGWEAIATYSPGSGGTCFDICFYPPAVPGAKSHAPLMPLVRENAPPTASQSYWLDPLKGRFTRVLTAQLKAQVAEFLPDYMRPSSYIYLDSFPITANGKLDVRSLIAPEAVAASTAPETALEPQTPAQQQLSRIWCDVLGIDRVGVSDNFFALGGHSLLATKLVSRLRDATNLNLPLRTIFEYPTLAAQAEQIESLQAETTPTPEPSASLIEPVPRDRPLPLSFSQQRLWFLDRLQPGNPAYNISVGFEIAGQLHREALVCSIAEIVRRHEALRTNFALVDGVPVQIVGDPWDDPVQFVEAIAKEDEIQKAIAAEIVAPFNLQRDRLLRVFLYQVAPERHLLLAVVHHIVFDAWSLGILVEELTHLYRALSADKIPNLLQLSLQYGDFAHWQRTQFETEQLPQQLAYWVEALRDRPQPLQLPTDFPRPEIASSQGRAIAFNLNPDTSQRFKQLCEDRGATLFMGLLAVFAVVLNRFSGQDDLIIGTPIANRQHRQTERLIGFFVNTLALRVDLKGNPQFFSDLLARIKTRSLEAFAHQDVPFEKLVEVLELSRSLDRTPLFQVMFVLQNAPLQPLQLPGLQLTPLTLESQTSKFEFTLTMVETEDGIVGTWEYRTDLFASTTIEEAIAEFQGTVETILAAPDCCLSELEQGAITAPQSHLDSEATGVKLNPKELSDLLAEIRDL